MKKMKWITTEQMLEALRMEPDTEQQYCHHLGGILHSTHWLEYNSKRNLYGDSIDWYNYGWYTEVDFLYAFAGHWWMREH